MENPEHLTINRINNNNNRGSLMMMRVNSSPLSPNTTTGSTASATSPSTTLNDSNLSLDELDSLSSASSMHSNTILLNQFVAAASKKTRKSRPTSNDSIDGLPQIGITNEFGNVKRASPQEDEESFVMSDSSKSGMTSNTSRSSFSSMNSSFFEELEAQFMNTSRSIHLIHLLLHPVTKELFRQYCIKTRVCELFDCLEEIRLYYVAIDTFKTQSHKRKIEEMKHLLNTNQNSPKISASSENMSVSSSTDSLKRKNRMSLSASGTKLFSNKRQSVALLFNNNSNLMELLQEKIHQDKNMDEEISFMGLFSLGTQEKDQITIEDISKEERDSLKEKAQKIFDSFLSPKSNREVNIDSTLRSSIETNLKNLDSDHSLFEKLYEELRLLILRQLKTDVLFRFEKSSDWTTFLSDTHNVSVVEQVMDYSNSVWSANADFGGFKRMTKRDCVRDYVKKEDFSFMKHVLFAPLLHWKNLTKTKATNSPFSTSYSKGKYFIDQESIRLKFGCLKETATLPFSAEEVFAAIHSKLFQSITDDTLNVDDSIFCLKSFSHRVVEGILPTDISKFSFNLPIPLSNQRGCYQAHSTIYEPESKRYYYFSKPILFNENYSFEKESVQCYSFNMVCVEKIDDRNCKYYSAFISNFGGILKHFSSKVFKKIAWKRSNQTRKSMIEKLTENRDSLYNNTRDGYDTCMDNLKRYQSCSNISLDFPKTFSEFQERFCKYY